MAENAEKETLKLPLELLLKSVPTLESIATEASDLHRAAVTGDMELLRQSIDSGQIDINLLDEWGHTPLYMAALKGYNGIVEVLISKGAKINGTGDDTNPIHCARDVSTVKILLKAGGDMNAKDSKGNTSLHRAVMREDEGVVLLLLEHGADVSLENNEGCSALHTCCNSSGSETMVTIMKNLIARGININAIDYFGMTSLHYCAKWQCSNLAVKTLVSNGGNLQIRDYRGNCPVHYFRLYLEDEEGDFIETLKEFFPSPESANVTDMKGQTPLHLATDTSANVIATLLECGCHINARDNHGKTALHIASGLKKSADIIQNLIINGGNVNERDEWGRTPLHEAANAGNDVITKLLISHKADVNATDICGCTPLHESTIKDECSVVETLLKSGAAVNNADTNGSTPLHFAAWENCESLIDVLITNGAKNDLKDKLGQTPLDVAIYRKAEGVVRALVTNIDETNTPKVDANLDNVFNYSNCGGKFLTEENVKNMVENKEIVRKGHIDLQSYLGHILESPEIGRGCDDDEAIEIQQVMENLVQQLAEIIGKEDWRFRCKLIHAGSTSEGTKTRRPDEFDYIFALEEFSQHCFPVFQDVDSKVQTGVYVPAYYPSKTGNSDSRPECIETQMSVSVSDYASMELNNCTETDPFIKFAGSSTMPVYKMYDGFSQLLTKVIFSQEFPRNPKLLIKETTLDPAITLRWRGCRYKDLEISADLVPAIILPSWPDQFNRETRLLTPDILRLPSLVVPKMTAGGADEDLWRCSLALEETAIFRKLRPPVRNSYVTCKALISSLFCPLICFGENEEVRALYQMEHDSLTSEEDFSVHDEAEAVVPSYMLKMMFLAAVESKAEKFGIESVYCDNTHKTKSAKNESENDDVEAVYGPAQFMNVAKRSCDLDIPLVLDVFRRCEECIDRKFVPSFFNPKHNVLGSRAMGDEAGKAALFIKVIQSLLES